MKWFKRGPPRDLIYPFRDLTNAMVEKDADLYRKISHLIPSEFRIEWCKVYPEDFPQGAMSPATSASILPRRTGHEID